VKSLLPGCHGGHNLGRVGFIYNCKLNSTLSMELWPFAVVVRGPVRNVTLQLHSLHLSLPCLVDGSSDMVYSLELSLLQGEKTGSKRANRRVTTEL
jgi:hypothetical protein